MVRKRAETALFITTRPTPGRKSRRCTKAPALGRSPFCAALVRRSRRCKHIRSQSRIARTGS